MLVEPPGSVLVASRSAAGPVPANQTLRTQARWPEESVQAPLTRDVPATIELAPSAVLAQALLEQSAAGFQAAAELARRGVPLPNTLIEALGSGAPGVLRAVCWVLCQAPDPRAIRALVELLWQGPSEVRDEVARALLRIGTPESVSAIARALDDPRPALRLAALRAAAWRQADFLARLPRAAGHPLIKPIVAIVKSSTVASDRLEAVQVLRIWGFPEATPALVQALSDQSDAVRDAAVDALTGIARGRSRWAGTARDALASAPSE